MPTVDTSTFMVICLANIKIILIKIRNLSSFKPRYLCANATKKLHGKNKIRWLILINGSLKVSFAIQRKFVGKNIRIFPVCSYLLFAELHSKARPTNCNWNDTYPVLENGILYVPRRTEYCTRRKCIPILLKPSALLIVWYPRQMIYSSNVNVQ